MEKKKKKTMKIIPIEFYERNEIMKWKKKYLSKIGKEASKKGFG